MGKNDTPRNLRCSFCGKTQENVKKLVAGPGVFMHKYYRSRGA